VTGTVQGTLAATAVTAVARFVVSQDAVGVVAWWLTVQILPSAAVHRWPSGKGFLVIKQGWQDLVRSLQGAGGSFHSIWKPGVQLPRKRRCCDINGLDCDFVAQFLRCSD
jgi:hypothetical protein